jgi:hypothetical protein
MKTTFTYTHPVKGNLRHVITSLISKTVSDAGIEIKFVDDQGRTLGITTNQPFVFRTEDTSGEI